MNIRVRVSKQRKHGRAESHGTFSSSPPSSFQCSENFGRRERCQDPYLTREYTSAVCLERVLPIPGLPSNAAAEKRDFERFFQGFGELSEVKLMAGFAFVEFKDARDARDAVTGISPSAKKNI